MLELDKEEKVVYDRNVVTGEVLDTFRIEKKAVLENLHEFREAMAKANKELSNYVAVDRELKLTQLMCLELLDIISEKQWEENREVY